MCLYNGEYISGINYTVQFHPLDVYGVSNVMSTLNSAFRSLFYRLTSDMVSHEQVRLILILHQLDKPISLPFPQRDRPNPERTIYVNVNVVHAQMPHGGTGHKRNIVNLRHYN